AGPAAARRSRRPPPTRSATASTPSAAGPSPAASHTSPRNRTTAAGLNIECQKTPQRGATTCDHADPELKPARLAPARLPTRTKATKFPAPDSVNVTLYRSDPVESDSLPDSAAARRRPPGCQ